MSFLPPISDAEIARYVRLTSYVIVGDGHMLDEDDWLFISDIRERVLGY